MAKIMELPFGKRGKSNSDPALEQIRQAQADRQAKKLKREDEEEDIEHEKKMAKAEAERVEAEQRAEEARVGKQPTSPITFKQAEIDIHAGEKAERERAQKAEEDAKAATEKAEKLSDELAAERTRTLENRITQLSEDIKKTIESGGSKKTLSEQLEDLEKTASQLGFTKGGTGTLSPELQVELKKMDVDLQVKLEEMRDERDRRDKEWQLTLRRWDEEKEMRRAELGQKAEIEKERMNFLQNAQDRIGRIIAKTVKEGGGSPSTPSSSTKTEKKFHIEASEGEEGETTCPSCGGDIFIAPDAAQAVCPDCGLTAEIKRTRKPEAENPPAEEENVVPEGWEG